MWLEYLLLREWAKKVVIEDIVNKYTLCVLVGLRDNEELEVLIAKVVGITR